MDIATIKQRQQAAWAAGDYSAVGTRLLPVAELLCDAVDLRAGEWVLDVACGNVVKALATLGPDRAAALRADMLELVKRFDVADDATTILRMDYLEPVIRKPAA